MLDFSWKVFCMTGSVDTYLLMKELETEHEEAQEELAEELEEPQTSVN